MPDDRTLKLGAEGDRVAALREAVGAVMAVVFDNELDREVKEYQRRRGLTIDGWAGAQTLAALAADGHPIPEPPAPPPPSPWSLFREWDFAADAAELVDSDLRTVNGPFGNTATTGSVHTMRPSRVTIAGGSLRITAHPEAGIDKSGQELRPYTWTSGMIQSRIKPGLGTFFPLFARYEFRAKLGLPRIGFWPGGWLRHRDGASRAEVDVFELFPLVTVPTTAGRDAVPVVQTLHLPGVTPTDTPRRNIAKGRLVVDTTQWHTYAVEISDAGAGRVRFRYLIDDIETAVFVDTQAPTWTAGVDPQHFWDIAAQIFVGGSAKTVGLPTSQEDQVLLIDSIRIYTPRAA